MRFLQNSKKGDTKGLLSKRGKAEHYELYEYIDDETNISTATYAVNNADETKNRRRDMENRQRRSATPIKSGLYRDLRSRSRSPLPNDEKDVCDTDDLENNNCADSPTANSAPMANSTPISINQNENQLLMGALNNFGNSCYLNAVLYALRFTPSFAHHLHHFNENLEILFGVNKPTSELPENACAHTVASANIEPDCGEDCVLIKSNEHLVFTELHGVFSNLTTLEKTNHDEPFEATSLQLAVQEINNNFTARTQQDSHEFLMCILNCLRDSSDGLMQLANDKPDIFQK